MKTNIQGDFQICVSVTSRKEEEHKSKTEKMGLEFAELHVEESNEKYTANP